jgi:hypothetical protein
MNLVPQIRRARGYRLYAGNERRILDCYQEGGRALLGHRPGKLIHDTKNVLERGMLSAFPSAEQDRARRAVLHLLAPVIVASGLESVTVSFFPAESSLPGAAVAGCHVADMALPDEPDSTGDGSPDGGVVPLWRPWLPADRIGLCAAEFASSGVMVLRLPLPSLFMVDVFVQGSELQASEPVPPIAEPVFKAVSVVSRLLERETPPQAQSVLGFDACGPYLWMRDRGSVGAEEYGRRFSEFLDHDILISPDPLVPSIMPAECSDGEVKLLRRASAAILGAEHGN